MCYPERHRRTGKFNQVVVESVWKALFLLKSGDLVVELVLILFFSHNRGAVLFGSILFYCDQISDFALLSRLDRTRFNFVCSVITEELSYLAQFCLILRPNI